MSNTWVYAASPCRHQASRQRLLTRPPVLPTAPPSFAVGQHSQTSNSFSCSEAGGLVLVFGGFPPSRTPPTPRTPETLPSHATTSRQGARTFLILYYSVSPHCSYDDVPMSP